LTPADGAREDPEPAVAAPLSVFFAASSEAFFFTAASLAAFLFVEASWSAFFATISLAAFFFTTSSATSFAAAASATSFAATARVAATVSPAADLPLDPPDVIARAAADEAALGVGVAGGGPPAVDLPWPRALILFCSGTSLSDDTLLSLRMTHTTFPSPLPGARQGAVPPWLPAVPAPGICTPLD
jgi:hypothetical protein